MIERDTIYIDGAWVPSGGTGTIDVHGAATEEVIGRIPDGVAADVDRAVAAAKAAFPVWSATAPEERAKHLQRIQEGLSARQSELAELIATEVGMPLKLSAMIQVAAPRAAASWTTAISSAAPAPPTRPTTSILGSHSEIGPWRPRSGHRPERR